MSSTPVAFHSVWAVTLVLLVLGLCMVLSVSVATAFARANGDKFLYIKEQAVTAAIGLALMFVVSRIDYRKWRQISVLLLGVIVFSLLVMRVPGVSHRAGGSASWIPIGPYNFQPSEFAKLAVVLAGAYLLSAKRARAGGFKALMWPFGVVTLGVCGLVALEPDLGTALIIAGLAMGLFLLAGMKPAHWLALAMGGAFAAGMLTLMRPAATNRILAFLNPFADPQNKGFQLVQSLLALGRGGWLGAGPGASIQKFSYLPKAHTDMIFAILGEEFGLIGVGLVVLLFGLFALAAWRLARRCADPMGKLLIAGCCMLVTLEAIVNMGGVLGAMPLTGVPLPFISFGRNNLLVMFVAVGLILSVGRFASATPEAALSEEYKNVADIDRRRRDGGARRSRLGHS
jgi:cell division protein FtsW